MHEGTILNAGTTSMFSMMGVGLLPASTSGMSAAA
jgi:hypothetical protein